MSQKLSEYLMLVALILVTVSFVSEVVELWPILRTHVTTLLLIHFAAVLCITAIARRVHRKEVVMPMELMLLAAIMVATWYTYLSLLGKLVAH